MKFLKINSFLFLFFIVLSCTPNKNDLRALQKNGMDFPEMKRFTFKHISFLKPEMLTIAYNESFVMSSTNSTFQNYTLDLFFSVELFDQYDLESIQFSFDDEISPLDAIHDNYIYQRSKSLLSSETSIKKPVPNSVGFKGYTQIIHGKTYDEDEDASYFLATLEVESEYYVIQLIGKRENMGYLYNDFIDIISSIEN